MFCSQLQAFQTPTAAHKMERTAWAEWLVSVQSEIPEARYREYKVDSFNMAMRYIRDTQQPQSQLRQQTQPQHLQVFQPAPQFLPFTAHPIRVHNSRRHSSLHNYMYFFLFFLVTLYKHILNHLIVI